MTDAEVLNLIKEALHDVLPERKADWANVELAASIESLGLDSIATMELVGALEDATGKTFADEELTKVNAIKDLASLVLHGKVL